MTKEKLKFIIEKYVPPENSQKLYSEIIKTIVETGIFCTTCGEDIEMICEKCKKMYH